MSQPFRLPSGGAIDRSRPLGFIFDDRHLSGYVGDTLASALIANGVRVVGRSFKYHRRRGIMTAGAEEPNALVNIGQGASGEPNTRVTTQPLYEGLVATSQNRWPSLSFDVGRINDLASPLLPAGFYYKTFMRPRRAWRLYEHLIRRAAGLGRAGSEDDRDVYARKSVYCDVLVVGGGPAGIAAARAATEKGADVILVDENPFWGGSQAGERRTLDGKPVTVWLQAEVAMLAQASNCRLLSNTTAFGCYDSGAVALVERPGEAHGGGGTGAAPRQRRWLVSAGHIVFATGAIERPLVFAGNDLPGVMLARAARRYVNHYAVAPGRKAVVATNNPDAYRTAVDLSEAGIEVVAVVDARATPGMEIGRIDPARHSGAVGMRGHKGQRFRLDRQRGRA